MNIYFAADEINLEITGEFRQAKPGDWYWTGAKWRNWGAGESEWEKENTTIGPFIIGRKKKRKFEFDEQVFECPEGFVFERVGVPKTSDLEKYLAKAISDRPVLITGKILPYTEAITYFIFRKEPK